MEKTKPNENLMMMINRTSRAFRNVMQIESDKIGIIDTYRPIIISLSRAEGLTQQQLANMVRLSTPTISLTLNKMESAGLIKRVIDSADRRQVRLYLTELGHEYDNKMIALIHKMERYLFEGVSDEQQKSACEIINMVFTNILKFGGENNENI